MPWQVVDTLRVSAKTFFLSGNQRSSVPVVIIVKVAIFLFLILGRLIPRVRFLIFLCILE